jgi:acetyl-CoA carboxylase carboxyl transferase subunit beta
MIAKTKINNIDITAGAFNFAFIGGSVGAAEGEAIIYGIQHAIDNQNPFVLFTSGGGMRMFESLIALSQMTRTILAINELKKNNLPYLACLIDPTAGGITASFAMLGDIHFAEPGAIVAFSGARVIRATVKEELPEGFQKSEYVQKTGFIDLIVERKDLRKKIGSILSILLKKNSAINSITDETSKDNRTLTKAAS